MMTTTTSQTIRPSAAAGAIAAFVAALAAGCASYNPGSVNPGTPIATAEHALGTPVARYALPAGGERLEYARGASGRETYMLDFDAAGALVANAQVRTEANFATIAPGLSAESLLMRLGHPSTVIGVARQHLQVWNYRFVDSSCRWFQVSVGDAGVVTEAALGMDPECDPPTPN